MPRVFLITGSNRGLGLSLTTAALEAGDSVVATARDIKALAPLVERYGPDRVLPIQFDVTDAARALEVAQEAKAKFGRIDIVISNAGYAESSAIEDMTLDSFRSQVEANFLSVVYVTKAVLPIMREQRSGRILQVSSVGGRKGGSPGLGAYQAAKFAVAGFSTVLAAEVAPFGIKVTVLEPGGIATGWSDRAGEHPPVSEPYMQTVGAFEEYRRKASVGWTGPDNIAKAIMKITEVDDPPMRLLLGEDTLRYAEELSTNLRQDDEKWASVTRLED